MSASRNVIATAPEQTTTTNPYAGPAVIDAAYVNRVLAGLDAAVGDVVRMAMKDGAMTPEAIERMEAIYTGPPLELQMNLLIQDSIRGFPGMRPDPGNRKTMVKRLLSNRGECFFVLVERDFSPVSFNSLPELQEQYVGLKRPEGSDFLTKYNPTGWVVIYDGFEENRSEPPDPCIA